MADEDIELRREQFRWQRQRFLVLVVLATVGLATMGVFWVGNVNRSSYLVDREASYIFDKVRADLADNRARQEDLSRRLGALEVRQRNLEDVTQSSKETIDAMRKLIDELRA